MKTDLSEMMDDPDLNYRANLELAREFDEDMLVTAVQSLDPMKILSLRYCGSDDAQDELCRMLRGVIAQEAHRIRSEGDID